MSRRAHDERMSAEAFDAFARLCALSRKGRGFVAARLVLVEGMERAEAARASAIPEATLRVTLSRYRRLRELARVVAS